MPNIQKILMFAVLLIATSAHADFVKLDDNGNCQKTFYFLGWINHMEVPRSECGVSDFRLVADSCFKHIPGYYKVGTTDFVQPQEVEVMRSTCGVSDFRIIDSQCMKHIPGGFNPITQTAYVPQEIPMDDASLCAQPAQVAPVPSAPTTTTAPPTEGAVTGAGAAS